MNNEPVAYLVKAPDGEYLVFEKSEHPVMSDCTYIPLYTHPVKELTDEEIEVLASKHLCYQIEDSGVSGVFNFARAILRKAQEK